MIQKNPREPINCFLGFFLLKKTRYLKEQLYEISLLQIKIIMYSIKDI